MDVTTRIDEEDVAREMASEGEWAMNVLAYLATGQGRDRGKIIREISEGNTGSGSHQDVPAFLRDLANAIEAAK